MTLTQSWAYTLLYVICKVVLTSRYIEKQLGRFSEEPKQRLDLNLNED